MPKPKKKSEVWFEEALAERGIAGGDRHQPDLGGSAKPDYRIHRPTVLTRLRLRRPESVICEVKEFESTGMSRRLAEARFTEVPDGKGGTRLRGQFMTLSDDNVYGTARNKIAKAAKKQLREYASRGDALAVVLANPNGVEAPIHDLDDLVATMYGNPAWTIPINFKTGESGEGEGIFAEDGVFGGGKHRYVSAIITVTRRRHAVDFRERWTAEHDHEFAHIEDSFQRATAGAAAALEDPLYKNADDHFPGHYFAVRVVSTIGTATGEAVPVPTDLFTAEQDEYWRSTRRRAT